MWIVPKLTSLLLEMLDFHKVVLGSGVLFDLVMIAVTRREAEKSPLSTLCITHCIISKEEAAVLEKNVPDFRWDHQEVDYEGEYVNDDNNNNNNNNNNNSDDDDDYDDDYDSNGFDYDGDSDPDPQ